MASLKFAVIIDTLATQVLHKNEEGQIYGSQAPIGGIERCEAFGEYLRGERHFLVDRLTLQLAIQAVGATRPEQHERTTELKGRNIDTKLPTRFQVSTNEVLKAIQSSVDAIIRQAVHQITFRITASPFSTIDDEVLLSGDFGGLRGLDALLQQELRAKNFPEAIVVVKTCNVFDC